MPNEALVFELVPPILPPDYCFTGFQRYATDMFTRATVSFRTAVPGVGINRNPGTPTVDQRIFPWLNPINGRIYIWSTTYGLWISPMNPTDRVDSFRRWWTPPAGTNPNDIWGIDIDTDTPQDPATFPPTPVSGAAWVIDHDYDGRFPLGSGSVPTSSPTLTIPVGNTGGSIGGNVSSHVHPMGLTNRDGASTSDDAFFARDTLTNVPSYSGWFVQGSGDAILQTLTQADLFTLPPLTPASSSEGLPPYRTGYWVKPTIRIWYTLPG